MPLRRVNSDNNNVRVDICVSNGRFEGVPSITKLGDERQSKCVFRLEAKGTDAVSKIGVDTKDTFFDCFEFC